MFSPSLDCLPAGEKNHKSLSCKGLSSRLMTPLNLVFALIFWSETFVSSFPTHHVPIGTESLSFSALILTLYKALTLTTFICLFLSNPYAYRNQGIVLFSAYFDPLQNIYFDHFMKRLHLLCYDVL